MNIIKPLCALLTVGVIGYLGFAPIPVDPVAWEAPPNPGYTGAFFQNQQLSQVNRIELADAEGPEDLAIDSQGRVYFSLLNGDIKRMGSDRQVENWVNTGGRPLGIEFDQQGNLIVADAYLGLLLVTPDGVIESLVSTVDNVPVVYADDVDIASNGKVYFSDASTKFVAKTYGTYGASLLDILEHGGHGRLIEFDPASGQSTVIAQGINFANGVAISHDQKSVLINETGNYRVLRVSIEEATKGSVSVVIDNLPGFPDNLSQGSQGQYWVGLVSPRSLPLDMLSNQPTLRKVVQRLPAFMRPKAQRFGHLIAINDSGDVIHNLQDPLGMFGYTTGAVEKGDDLYISSLHEPALAVTVNPNAATVSQNGDAKL